MRKQMAIVIDASGSMFHPASTDCVHDKIVEASESVQWMLEEIKTHVQTTGDEWAVSLWYFAESLSGLVGQTLFTNSVTDMLVDIMKNVVQAVENQGPTQTAVGNLTDIFAAVRETSDWMDANPPTWASSPANGAPDKKVIFLFTDGNQTIPHNGSLVRAGYEGEQGVSFAALLDGRDIAVNAQGIGSDLLNATLTDLVDQGADGSTSKVISTTPGYAADCSAAIMTNSLAAVNNNGMLSLRPAVGSPSGLLWEQFTLPYQATGLVDVPTTHSTALPTQRLNHRDFEVDVDGISKEWICGLTWHQPGAPFVEATSPSGTVMQAGVGGAFAIKEGWMSALHIPNPEAGTWKVRVHGDPKWAPLRLNLMARGINPAFKFVVRASPFALSSLGATKVIATPKLDGKPADGKFDVIAHVWGGESVPLAQQSDGSFAGEVKAVRIGLNLVRVELRGEIKGGQSVQRTEYTTIQVGRARDPRIEVQPRVFQVGKRYDAEVSIHDASFDRTTQIRFGEGIVVRRFVVLNDQRAQADIQVLPDAAPGRRDVITFYPDAATLKGIEVTGKGIGRAPGDRSRTAGGSKGRICCLRFDNAGCLEAIVLCDGRMIPLCSHDARLQSVLERARDANQRVEVFTDAQGCLTHVHVCR